MPTEHSCPKESFSEIRRLDRISTKFLNLFARFQTDPAKQRRNLRAQSALAPGILILGGIPQNLAHLFFHAAAMALGAPLQLCFNGVFQVAHDQLSHEAPHPAMIS